MDSSDATRLDDLESDIAAVASAMDSLDRIVAESPGGESAAAEIAAVVSPERFPLGSDPAQKPLQGVPSQAAPSQAVPQQTD
jgi:hypothetical protein